MTVRGIVYCDSCGHEEPNQDIASWHGCPCPACGVAPIVDDADMLILRQIEHMMEAGLASQGEDNTGVSIVVDTGIIKRGAA